MKFLRPCLLRTIPPIADMQASECQGPPWQMIFFPRLFLSDGLGPGTRGFWGALTSMCLITEGRMLDRLLLERLCLRLRIFFVLSDLVLDLLELDLSHKSC